MTEAARRQGAWGRRWLGVGPAALALNQAPPEWPAVAVTVRYEIPTATVLALPMVWRPNRAEFLLRGGGRIVIRSEPPSVDLCLPRPVAAECLVQPHLASAAAALGIWTGCAALHGGAFVHAGRAWGVVGDKGAGKSSVLGQLAQAGCTVLADDLVIWRNGELLAGPRCVDLRADAARALGVGRPLGVIGSRERWRVDLSDSPPAVEFGGLIWLQWAREPALRPLTVQERLALVLSNGALPVPPEPAASSLELAASPGLLWSRPKEWDRGADAIRSFLDGLPGR